MSIQILRDSFTEQVADVSEVGEHYAKYINGKINLDLGNGKQISTWAIKRDASISALGFVGRYRTSTKAWRASVMSRDYPNHDGFVMSCRFGRDDRAGVHHKQNAISFEPKTFFAI